MVTARRRARAGAVAALLLMVGLGGALGATSAQWSDPAVVAATASAGSWGTQNGLQPTSCEVRRRSDGGKVGGFRCSVSLGHFQHHGTSNGSVTMTFDDDLNPFLFAFYYVVYAVDLDDASAVPAAWDWSDYAVTGVTQGAVSSPCSELPVIEGSIWGWATSVTVSFSSTPGCS